jgi:hypothetical protein
MLRSMAERIGARITEVQASHAVFLTQPGVVADVIDQAARGVAPSSIDQTALPSALERSLP